MKLAELKTSLVEQFFTTASSGLPIENLSGVYEALRKKFNCEKIVLESEFSSEIHSNEPSKAFAQFTKDRESLIIIIEEDGMKKKALFAAAKYGTQIAYTSLIKEQEVKTGDLKIIKDALRQAKNLNDEVDFHIITI